MSSLVISGDTSGTVTVTVPAVAGTNTATLPASTGTVMVSGNMPAFSAYQSSLQTSATSTLLKILFQTEEFDTNNNFSSSTFTPTVAGYYQINSSICMVTSVATWQQCRLYKNGSFFKQSFSPSSSSAIDTTGFSGLVYANGTTDYFEIYGVCGFGQNTNPSQTVTWFTASLVRAA